MENSTVYTELCYYDKRNPNCSMDDDEIKDHFELLKKKKDTCSCDNCFYGRTKLAEKIILLHDALRTEFEKNVKLTKRYIDAEQFILKQGWFIKLFNGRKITNFLKTQLRKYNF